MIVYSQTFRCRPGLVMTVNFLYLTNDIDDSAMLSFYDGTAVTSPLLGSFKVDHGMVACIKIAG